MLPVVTANRERSHKRSLLLEVDSNIIGRDVSRQTMISIGWNPTLRRTSTNNNNCINYFSEALQINSARRTSLADCEEKEK